MKQVVRNIVKLTMLIFATVTFFGLSSQTAEAKEVNEVVKNLEILTQNDSSITPGEEVVLTGNWQLPDDDEHKSYTSGDFFTIKLPKVLEVSGDPVELVSNNGKVVYGTGIYDKSTHQYKFTFSKAIDGKYNRRGGFSFSTTLSKNVKPETKETIEVTAGKQVEKIQVTIAKQASNQKGTYAYQYSDNMFKTEDHNKNKSQEKGIKPKDGEYPWYIAVNKTANPNMNKLKLVDTVGKDSRLLKNSIKVYENYGNDKLTDVTWNGQKKRDITKFVDIKATDHGFEITLQSRIVDEKEKIRTYFHIFYSTEYTGIIGNKWVPLDNTATLVDYQTNEPVGKLSQAKQQKFISKGWGEASDGIANLTVTKIDEETGNPLEGAEFELYKGKKEPGTLVTQNQAGEPLNLVSNKDGQVTVNNLQPGPYYLKEKKAPSQYQKSDDIKIIFLRNESDETIEFSNKKEELGQITVDKEWKGNVSKDEKVAVQFGLWKKGEDKPLMIRTLDAGNKSLVFGELALDNDYIVKEIVPEGSSFSVDKSAETVTLTKEQKTGNVTFINTIEEKIKTTEVAVEKVWDVQTKDLIKPVEVAITKTVDDKTSDVKTVTLNTDNEWKTTVKDLPTSEKVEGKLVPVAYGVKELTVSKKIETTITGDATKGFTIINKEKQGTLEIIKVDANNKDKTLPSATFEITGPDGYQEKATTSKDGNIVLSGLAFGDYKVKETNAPEGYELSKKVYDVRVEEDKTGENVVQLVVENKSKLGTLEIIKVDANNKDKTLPSATFEITGPNGYQEKATTSKDGNIVLTGLAFGDYKVKETNAPEGYELSKKVYDVRVEEDKTGENVVQLVVENKSKLGTLEIIKVDANNKDKTLPSATFEITGPNGYQEKATTSKDGNIVLSGLAFGDYQVKETNAPEGYELSKKVYDVRVEEDKTGENVVQLVVENAPIIGSFQLVKVDKETRTRLPGATFTLVDALGNENQKTTDENGHIEFANLSVGQYKLYEISAPKGYIIDQDYFNVNIDLANGGVTVTIINPTTNKKVGRNSEGYIIDNTKEQKTTPSTTPSTVTTTTIETTASVDVDVIEVTDTTTTSDQSSETTDSTTTATSSTEELEVDPATTDSTTTATSSTEELEVDPATTDSTTTATSSTEELEVDPATTDSTTTATSSTEELEVDPATTDSTITATSSTEELEVDPATIDSGKGTKNQKMLPKTGETTNYLLVLVGGLSMLVALFILMRQKKYN
ncbi:hypothetical protein BW732_03165 [Vagococcus penaei]|uniref:Gram-positive cocci surface proteins LPxTG domain-containing protein n=1 Tax=Vagococcus penaei TaxID=633807 RepID=A0A1Q2D4J5_9ENTE|nr:SpaA isopeptide-forming pilin-related protein [Vagococcus penaei]AQP53330.1 hypothetical protein BW732_03165 [Vagococcus penaei]